MMYFSEVWSTTSPTTAQPRDGRLADAGVVAVLVEEDAPEDHLGPGIAGPVVELHHILFR